MAYQINFKSSYRLVTHPLLILLFFSTLYTLFFSPVIFSGRLLGPTDAIVQGLPAFYSPRTLWTNLLFSGYPVAADPQVQTWYPISLIFSLIPDSWNAFIISAYVMASCFTYAYVYQLTNSKLSALISGLSYGMSAALVDRLVFVNMVHTVAWLPLVLWGLENLNAATNKNKWILVTAISISFMFLAGHPQSFVYGMAVIITYMFAYVFAVRFKYTKKASLKHLVNFIYVGTLSICIVAIALIPQLELAKNSVRANMPFSGFITGSLNPLEFINLVYPFLFGGYSQSSIYYEYFGYLAPHESATYAGLLSLLFIFILIISKRKLSWQAKFWLVWIVVTMVLAMGGYTPLARITYHIPGYNIFRGPSRHTFEIALAVAVLAGLGAKNLFSFKYKEQQRLIKKTIVISLIFGAIANLALWLFTPQLIARAATYGIQITSFMPWSNLATLIPLSLLTASILLFCWIGFGRTYNLKLKKVLLVILLCIDLASASWFGLWHYATYPSDISVPQWVNRYANVLNQTNQRLATIEGVRWNNQDLAPNVSRLWNIPNLSGYNPLVLSRYSELLGISPLGEIAVSSLLPQNSTLDLLASRYITIYKKPLPPVVSTDSVTKNEIIWQKEDLNVKLASNLPDLPAQVSSPVPSAKINSLSIVSSMTFSTKVLNNTPIINISLTSDTGSIQTLTLRAGRDTSESEYDNPDSKSPIQHSRAKIFDSLPKSTQNSSVTSYDSHNYAATLILDKPQQVNNITLRYVGPPGVVANIHKITIKNDRLNQFYPLKITNDLLSVLANTSRWHPVENIDETIIYENLRAMPRTWLVPEVVSAKPDRVIHTIKSSKLPDGRLYDPSKIAFVEESLNFKVKNFDAQATAKIVQLDDSRIEVKTNSQSPAFLVLSDVYYPGWQATIDSKVTHIFQTNYLLRGILLPRGNHVIRFEFKPASFHIGAGISIASLFLIGYIYFIFKSKF